MSDQPVARPRGHALEELFEQRRGVLIGVVHASPLPGAPEHDGAPVGAIRDRALADADAYARAGLDGLIVENHGDVPFLKPGALGPETAAVMAVITERVRVATGLPVGVNVLANAALHALAVAKAAGAAFVRVNRWANNACVVNEGLIEGPAAEALRYRRALHAGDVRIFADSHVKHGAHAITADRGVAELTRDLEWSGADVAIATGQRTGDAAAGADLAEIRDANPAARPGRLGRHARERRGPPGRGRRGDRRQRAQGGRRLVEPGRSSARPGLRGGRGARRLSLLVAGNAAVDLAHEVEELVDLVVLNAVEAAALAPVPCALAVVTEGPAGARLIRAGETRRVPAPASAAVDSTGAGDVVCGVLAAGLEQGLAPEPALLWAMAAAAAKVARAGTLAALPGAAELRRLRPA